ncbi:pyridoxamine 5'-phosphate oxidase family protein [Paenibacillus sp.]|uniref:pyridoxamine 5'-phosphate oxidase family protein n=1 Tax=Paenibacillus sp. TaxID=58172 RepID=UPI002D5F2099|nr:pyridoxamine 5'-phosphate oxidase family protein [Paenibacillus sp.]HZG58630.1 pyridoxamine 5'-phosphate oxidase family protein [Paenibacillus sp.]
MRRKEFDVSEAEEIERFLAEMSFGFLGTIGEDGYPHMTPLNFVYKDGAFYMHGARAGQKMKNLRADERVTFAVAKEYALIPSYWLDPALACPATAFFKSVFARGTAVVVEDIAEKADAFEAFMRKLQPEGGYDPFSPDHPQYAKELKAVAMIKIVVAELTAKFKFGQNWPEVRTEHVAGALEQRGRPLDPETAELMRRYCPHHRSE